MLCLLKNCRKCSGDLILDGDEWRCWQCGQYYYPMSESPEMLEEPPNPEMVAAGGLGRGPLDPRPSAFCPSRRLLSDWRAAGPVARAWARRRAPRPTRAARPSR